MKRVLWGTLLIVSVIIGGLGLYVYNALFSPILGDDITIQIPSNSSFDDVKDILTNKGITTHAQIFEQLAKRMNFIKSPMRSGQFELKKDSGLVDIIRHLRNGKQKAVNLVVNINWTVDRVAGKLAPLLELDSIAILNALENEELQSQLNYNGATSMSLFIPNSYQVYWNTSGVDLVKRLHREAESFWSQNDRISKAKELDMTPEEVYTLASIVERETNQNEEKRRMAGVYLNRIKRGMPLQADPTVKFGIGDMSLKRILNKHLKHPSPYNTYIHTGLPPGPISMASIASIDAVLDAEQHNYLYFCRRPDETGLHEFAKSLTEHNRNASAYHNWYRKNFL